MPTDKKQSSRGAAAEKKDRRILPERRAAKERRSGTERREKDEPVAVERRSGKERRDRDRRDKAPGDRRKVERRINEYPLKDEVLEFINAINEFKTVNQKPFPTWTEIYEIFVGLGYRKE
jgi:hypothetical protein